MTSDLRDPGATPPDLPDTVPLDLLRRYMAHVCHEEGVTCAEWLSQSEGFSADEIKLLKRLSDETDSFRNKK